jgi:hypothetical protein
MGDAYARWLIAKGSVFFPSSAGIAKLVERLRKEKWIPDPASPDFSRLEYASPADKLAASTGGYAVHTVEYDGSPDFAARMAASHEALPRSVTADWLDDPDREELRIVWPVHAGDPLPVRYPLTRRPGGAASYALELHRSADYVVPVADEVGPLASRCACGDDLAFGWDEDEVIPAFEGCSGIFAECEACSRTFDPAKGAATITDPFDGSKREFRGGAAHRFALRVDCGASFVKDASVAFAPELVALVQEEFGRDFLELGTVY